MREIKFRFWIEKVQKMTDWETAKKECDRLSLLELGGFIPMQYAGAKDKNEKEMYQDDIFKWGNLTGRIIFDDGCFVFKCPGYGMTLRDHDATEFEIIGNIYEYPELLCQPEKESIPV